jgi:Mlc titration factor MtfA (ptsG expression regulator)
MADMLSAVFSRLKARYRAATTRTVPQIDEALWRHATEFYIFVRGLTAEENRRLRLIASDFLARKKIIGAADHELTPLMKVQIAAQACILVLELGVDAYRDWSDIIVYPGKFMPEREVMDEFGVVHTTRDTLAGEAWLGGPVVLSYEDVAMASDPHQDRAGYNVVIHEFAHKLDMQNGDANGFPALHKGMKAEAWKREFTAAYLDFCERVDSAQSDAALDALAIDPYASESPAEFFAVMSEAFFELPETVMAMYPAIYAQLKLFYRQDPGQRIASSG